MRPSHHPKQTQPNPMENTRRRKNSSGDKFSFPIIPIIQDEFEFGSATPTSPNSPADHLFLNGKLLPHTFPFQYTNTASIYSRSTSRTSSVSSKDSLLSSRSNSTNSRSSSCSSARTSTSTSEASEQRKGKTGETGQRRQINRGQPQFGNPMRWQFIAPAPVLSRQCSRRRGKKGESGVGVLRLKGGGSGGGGEEKKGKKGWFGRRFFRWFVAACRECHAIEPARRKSGVLKGKMEL